VTGQETKKRHHYVPQAYLRAFCNSQGRIEVYPKDYPTKPYHAAPDKTGVERYYYSQPTPDGDVDHNRLEDMFSDLESKWQPLVAAMHRREDINDRLEALFEFVIAQRVRVPASRDATEARLAAEVHQHLIDMVASGEIARPPEPLADRMDEIIVSIDPHKSIHAMVEDIQASHVVFDRIGLVVLHNATGTPFLTSDNPVIWFDPTEPFDSHSPYAVKPDGEVALYFPVSPTLLVVGGVNLKERFASEGVLHGDVPDAGFVELVNIHVARYAYRAVYASQPPEAGLVEAFAGESPVWRKDGRGGGLVFGERAVKPKWGPREAADDELGAIPVRF